MTDADATSEALAPAADAQVAAADAGSGEAEVAPTNHPLVHAVTASPIAPVPDRPAPARLLPVVREGSTYFVAVRDIVAVHANAHYTYLFDGTSKLFCPLAIGEVEARLDTVHFARVHRSHIVNLERVVGLKRNGDHGLIQLSGHDPYTVPVSRSRFGGLKSQLGLGQREAIS